MSDCAFHLYMAWVRIGTMRSFRSKPVGWRQDSYRHYLAAKGVKSKYFVDKQMSNNITPEEIKRRIEAKFGKPRGDPEVDRLKEAARNWKPLSIGDAEIEKKVDVPTEIFPDDTPEDLVKATRERERIRNERIKAKRDEFDRRHAAGENPKDILKSMTEREFGVLENRQQKIEKELEKRWELYKEDEARRAERNLELSEEKEKRDIERGATYDEYLESQQRDMRLRRVNQKLAEELAKEPESAVEVGIRNTKLYELQAKKERLEKEFDEDEL